jgi:hypothetical protein
MPSFLYPSRATLQGPLDVLSFCNTIVSLHNMKGLSIGITHFCGVTISPEFLHPIQNFFAILPDSTSIP